MAEYLNYDHGLLLRELLAQVVGQRRRLMPPRPNDKASVTTHYSPSFFIERSRNLFKFPFDFFFSFFCNDSLISELELLLKKAYYVLKNKCQGKFKLGWKEGFCTLIFAEKGSSVGSLVGLWIEVLD